MADVELAETLERIHGRLASDLPFNAMESKGEDSTGEVSFERAEIWIYFCVNLIEGV